MDLNNIRFLESTDNIKSLVLKRTGHSISTIRAREITSCVQQGRQFYEAALTSPLEIRPLIQFYGMVGFAKALILSQRLCALSTLAGSHGLRDISPHNATLVELKARIDTKGTFSEFNNEVSKINRLCYFGKNSKPLSIAIPTADSDSLANEEITLKEVLARTSSAYKLFRYTFSETPENESLSILYYDEHNDYFTIRLVDPNTISDRPSLRAIMARWRNRFPYLSKWQVTEASNSWGESYITLANLICQNEDDLSDASLSQTGEGQFVIRDLAPRDRKDSRQAPETILAGVGGGYSNSAPIAIAPIRNKYLSEFSIHYIGLFLLSSLVRYRPDTWAHAVSRTALQDRPVDDKALALIQQFLEANYSDIPSLIIQALNPNEDKFA